MNLCETGWNSVSGDVGVKNLTSGALTFGHDAHNLIAWEPSFISSQSLVQICLSYPLHTWVNKWLPSSYNTQPSPFDKDSFQFFTWPILSENEITSGEARSSRSLQGKPLRVDETGFLQATCHSCHPTNSVNVLLVDKGEKEKPDSRIKT